MPLRSLLSCRGRENENDPKIIYTREPYTKFDAIVGDFQRISKIIKNREMKLIMLSKRHY